MSFRLDEANESCFAVAAKRRKTGRVRQFRAAPSERQSQLSSAQLGDCDCRRSDLTRSQGAGNDLPGQKLRGYTVRGVFLCQRSQRVPIYHRAVWPRSEEHTSELQSLTNLV